MFSGGGAYKDGIEQQDCQDFNGKVNKFYLMRVSCGNDVVCCLNDSVKRRVSSDRHVGSAEVVVDRSDHTNNVQVAKNIHVNQAFFFTDFR